MSFSDKRRDKSEGGGVATGAKIFEAV